MRASFLMPALILAVAAETHGVTLDTGFVPVIADNRNTAISQLLHLPAGGFLAIGEFVQVQGKWVPGVVKLSESGEVVENFNPPVTSVEAAVIDPAGRIYLQTQYTRLAGYGPVLRVAADGTLDASFKIPADASGKMFLLSSGELMLVDGPRAAVYDNNGAVKGRYTPGAENSTAIALISGDRLLFSMPDYPNWKDGAYPFLLRCVRYDGVVDRTFPDHSLSQPLLHARELTSGKILTIGYGGSYDGHEVGGNMMLLADGSLDPTYSSTPYFANACYTTFEDGTIVWANNSVLQRMDATGATDPKFNGTWVAAGYLGAAARTANGDYLVGIAGKVGGSLYNGPVLVSSSGARLSTYTPDFVVSGTVSAAMPVDDGTLWIQGAFTHVNGIPCDGIAHLDWQGRLVKGSQAEKGGVWMRDAKGRMVVVRSTYADGTEVWRYNPDGSLDVHNRWPGVRAGTSITGGIADDDGKIVLISPSALAENPSRNRIARFNLDGTLDPSFDAGNILDGGFWPSQILRDSQGRYVVAGGFLVKQSGFNTEARGLVRLNGDGSVDPTFAFPGVSEDVISDAYVDHLSALPKGGYLISGTFRYLGPIGGLERNAIAAIDEDGHPVLGYDAKFRPWQSVISSSLVPGGRSMVFVNYDGQFVIDPQFLDRNGSRDTTNRFEDSTIAPWTKALPLSDGTLLLYGNMRRVQGRPVAGLARVALSNPQTATFSNMSVRANLAAGQPLITGVVAARPTSVLFRGVGPALAAVLPSYFTPESVVPDPRLTLFAAGAAQPTFTNESWTPSAIDPFTFAAVGAFPLGVASKDAAFARTIDGGSTVWLESPGQGVALFEMYGQPDGSVGGLINISARCRTDRDLGSLIAGFALRGSGTKRLLIRGVGPGLAQFGISGVAADPVLTLYDGAGHPLASNDNWTSDAAFTFRLVNAFGLPSGSKDAAIAIELPASADGTAYSAVVTPATTGGEALVEVYEIP